MGIPCLDKAQTTCNLNTRYSSIVTVINRIHFLPLTVSENKRDESARCTNGQGPPIFRNRILLPSARHVKEVPPCVPEILLEKLLLKIFLLF